MLDSDIIENAKMNEVMYDWGCFIDKEEVEHLKRQAKKEKLKRMIIEVMYLRSFTG